MIKNILFVILIFGSILTAKINPNWTDSLIIYEKQFFKNDSLFAPKGEKWFRYLKGSKKILITAPHATAQTRKGQVKQSESGTGALALALHKMLKVPVLVTTYMSPSDPNYYDKNEFKDSLTEIINRVEPDLVLDLHGAHPDRPFDIDFGTMYGKSYLNKKVYLDSLKVILKRNGLRKLSKDFFPAKINRTITRFVHKKGIPCIQLEINSDYLMPEKSEKNYQKTQRLIKSLKEFLK